MRNVLLVGDEVQPGNERIVVGLFAGAEETGASGIRGHALGNLEVDACFDTRVARIISTSVRRYDGIASARKPA